jgi:integrase
MRTIAKDKSRPSKSFIEQREILGGDAIIYRTVQNGPVYQFRTWIPEEQKYYRKSLKTRDLATAIDRGKKMYYGIQASLLTGKKIFGITMGELVDLFLQHQMGRVATGKITQGRYSTIRTQLYRHFFCFVGAGNVEVGKRTKVGEIDPKKFQDYAQYRRLNTEGVREVTIRNEQTTFNALFKWCHRNGYCDFERGDFEEIRVRDVERRDTFTLDEYKKLYRFMRYKWLREQCSDKELQDRRFIRDFILIKANTFMRFGELRQLRWNDVRVRTRPDDKKYVEVRVRKETAKNRKERTVVARGGEYFERIKTFSKHVRPGDFVFADNETGNMLSKKVYYGLWDDLMQKLSFGGRVKKLTYYSLRHFGITMRRYAGVSFEDLSLLAGTSYNFIENHYSHVDVTRLVEAAMKDFQIDKDGFIIRGDDQK